MNIYVISLVFTVIISLVSAILVFKRRKIEGAKALFLLMISVSIWSFCYIFEIISKDFSIKLFWYNCEYIGISTIPLFWLIFALKYTDVGKQEKINKKLWFLSIPAVLTITMVWTNKYHGLFIRNIAIADNNLVPVLIKTDGIGYWMHILFSYAFVITGIIILLSTFSKLNWFFSKQGLFLSIGALLPLVGTIFNLFDMNPFYPFDISPSTFAISGIILIWCLLNLKTFYIVPIARDLFFNKINHGILILDNDSRIIDMNKTMLDVLDVDLKSVIGSKLDSSIKDEELRRNLNQYNNNSQELTINKGNDVFYYTINKIPIESKNNIGKGSLIELHNITKRRLIENALIDSKNKLFSLNKILYEINTSKNEQKVVKILIGALKRVFELNMTGFLHPDGKQGNAFSANPKISKIMKEKFVDDKALKKSSSMEKVIAIPILNIGSAVCTYNKDIPISDEDVELCKLLLGYTFEAIKRIELQEILRNQAERDTLTGSYNRRYFDNIIEKEIERSKRHDYQIYFLMVDINRFKEINDKYGHQVGDTVLKETYKVISNQIRKIDTIIRYGGDEFLIIVPNIKKENITGLIERMKNSIKEWSGSTDLTDFEISLSIGMSYFDPKKEEFLNKILYFADMDMYKDKKRIGKAPTV